MSLIPGFIIDSCRNNRMSGEFKAYAMFIDIAGFTAMTQNLMSHGKEGAEIMSAIINDIFTPSIKEIYKNGGFISTFAGDAFTSIFRVKKPEYILRAGFAIQEIFETKGRFDTKSGIYELAVKIGLSSGTVKYRIIDADAQRTFYFRGDAVDNCASAEHQAESKQIIADKRFMDSLSMSIDSIDLPGNYFLLSQKPVELPRLKIKRYSTDPEAERLFVPDQVLELKAKGEFREIVSCFISFSEEGDFISAIKEVIKKCHRYGGYFNRADFGDKGPVILIIFGAPTGRERLSARAADFLLSLRDIPAFSFRAGISKGTAFTGFIGSEKRREYTAIGGTVSLSARMMMSAEWGTIIAETGIARILSKDYKLKSKGFMKFKGFSDKIEVFSLESKITTRDHLQYTGCFIGRKKETEKLKRYINPVFNNKFGGAVYIDGPAGIGKTRFIADFMKNTRGCSFFYLPCDEILKKSFNPFIHFFKHYFNQNELNAIERNRKNFQNKYRSLIKKTKDELIKKELKRDISIISALIGLQWKNSLYSRLGPSDRYENTLYAVKNFFKACSLLKPLVLILEDGHWIDNDSLELIKRLVRNVKQYAFIIISLCRPNDDGTPVELFGKIPSKRISMIPFSRENMTEFLADRLQSADIPDKTRSFILEKSEGNPFFAEQIILYLTEGNILDKKLKLSDKAYDIPSGINQIILARIDRLSSEMKNTIKTASVLGREFALQVLQRLLYAERFPHDEEYFRNKIEEGCREQIWETISEIRYIFRHALIRDVVYEIQLKARIRKLHGLAGKIIEEIYNDRIAECYEDLAEHFDKADNSDKALYYLQKAGLQSQERYQNEKAAAYYNRLIKYLLDNKDFENTIRFLLKKVEVLELSGRLDDAIKTSEKALSYAKQIKNRDLEAECLNNLGQKKRIMGNHEEAMAIFNKVLILSEKAGPRHEYGLALSYMGNIMNLQCEYEKAMEYYQKAKEIFEDIGYKRGLSNIINSVGIVYTGQSRFTEALDSFKNHLTLEKELGNIAGISASERNIGMLYIKQGNLSKALEHLQLELKICEERGDRYGISGTYDLLGRIYQQQGDFEKASDYMLRALPIKEEIGNKYGISLTYANIGTLYDQQGDYKTAMDYFHKSIALSRELKDKENIGKVLCDIGIVYGKQGNYEKALESFYKDLEISQEIGNLIEVTAATNNIGLTYKHMGDLDRAKEYYSKALSLYKKLKNHIGVSIAISNMASVYHLQGNYEKALDYYDRAIKSARRLGIKYHLCSYLSEKADIMYNKDSRKANMLNSEAHDLAKKAGRNDIIFNTNILSCKLDKDKKGLLEMLNDYKEKEQKAMILYELYNMTREPNYASEALKAYKQLLKKSPKHEYKKRIQELEKI